MPTRKISDVLTHAEVDLLRRTIGHFLRDPDYATGEETGRSFQTLEFGQPLPLELVIRDWRTELDDGTGGREYRNGDCYPIYLKLYEGDIAIADINPVLDQIM
jgi:hypothetical protein